MAWRDWYTAFPIREKRPHEILGDTVARRLLDVTRRLNGRNAIQSYLNNFQAPVTVLAAESLVGWRCDSNAPISFESLSADVLAFPPDYSWVFCNMGYSERYSKLLRYVYVDQSCFPDLQKPSPGVQ